jgi:hypothetical protein
MPSTDAWTYDNLPLDNTPQLMFDSKRHSFRMRRLPALLLLAVFSFPLIAPVLAASPDSQLPPCCRRDGKHHCAMMAMQSESESGPSLRTNRCPLFPAPRTVPGVPAVSLPGTPRAIFAGFPNRPTSRPKTEALCRISYSRAGQKRGPPSSIA